jgi:hypothetical protein
MNIVGKLATIFDPEVRRNQSEAEEARARFKAQEEQHPGMRPSQWYRLSNAGNNIVGLSFVCNCRKEVQFLNLFQWLVEYECPQCRVKYELLKAVGLTPDSPIKALSKAIATLPVRPRAAGEPPRPKFLDTWASSDDGVGYERHDPGMAGFGVGFGGR